MPAARAYLGILRHRSWQLRNHREHHPATTSEQRVRTAAIQNTVGIEFNGVPTNCAGNLISGNGFLGGVFVENGSTGMVIVEA